MAHPSMTGFGSAQTDCPTGRLSLELRSVNSRYFELHPRLPDEFRWSESHLRERLQAAISRGKVELRVGMSRTEASLSQTQINPAGLASALRLAHEIRCDHEEITPFSVNDLLRLPGVLIEPQLSQDEWLKLLNGLLTEALQQFTTNRQAEGQRLAEVIEHRLDQLTALCAQAQTLVPEAIAAQQQRLSEKLREAIGLTIAGKELSAEHATALEDRIRQEAAVYGLRIDIAEEIDRLGAHLAAARQTLNASANKSGIGKRLDFLTQEMNREANTLGSKSASIELSKISIEMKLLIEQIREQVQNLE
ncbi:MAG: YicC family protein [Burkholderiaceae bacterium]|nr:YicC family protein [Burkholderiaceae bacterium]